MPARLKPHHIEALKSVYYYRRLSSKHLVKLLESTHKGRGEKPASFENKVVAYWLRALIDDGYLYAKNYQFHPRVYTITNKGAEKLTEEINGLEKKIDWGKLNRKIKNADPAHDLAGSDFLVCIDLASRKKPNLSFTLPPPSPKNKDFEISARLKTENGQVKKQINPDGVFSLTQGRRQKKFMFELDRGTMPEKRSNLYQSSIYKKMLIYQDALKHDYYKKKFDFKNVRIPFVVDAKNPEGRIKNMIELNREIDPKKKGSRLFYFTGSGNIDLEKPTSIFGRIWTDGTGKNRSLLD